MGFNILYHQDALRDLEKIKKKNVSDAQHILKKIETLLITNPFPSGLTIKKLRNIYPAMYRLRVNASVSYRVFYRITGNLVYILKVIAKKDADKVLKKYFR